MLPAWWCRRDGQRQSRALRASSYVRYVVPHVRICKGFCRLQAGYASIEAECRPLARGQSAAGGNKSAKLDLAWQDVTAYQCRLGTASSLRDLVLVALSRYTDIYTATSSAILCVTLYLLIS